ncbi:hypothetical protein FF1_039994 [Malus domestica]
MSDFPPELLFDILSRLPPKDLIRFLCVSKAWNAIIHHHHFIKAHLQRSIQTNSFRTILVRSIGSPSSDFLSSAFDGSETFRTAVKIERPLKSPERYQIQGCSIRDEAINLTKRGHLKNFEIIFWANKASSFTNAEKINYKMPNFITLLSNFVFNC